MTGIQGRRPDMAKLEEHRNDTPLTEAGLQMVVQGQNATLVAPGATQAIL